jgi:predicted ArsR family transcriptional regulator
MNNVVTLDDQPKNSRERVLNTLLLRQYCTINDIAEAVQINPISVRHHITRLQAEGLVGSSEERHGVGRPRLLYFLTDEGRELFPSRYLRLTLLLLSHLKEKMPGSQIDELFNQIAYDLAAEEQDRIAGLSIEQRLELIKKLLNREGFRVDWERQGESFQIREVSCPYFHIGQNHPEICVVDQTLINLLIDAPVQKTQCMLRGDTHCVYIIPGNHPMEI